MSELAKRALTGGAYVALTLGAAWAGPVTTTLRRPVWAKRNGANLLEDLTSEAEAG